MGILDDYINKNKLQDSSLSTDEPTKYSVDNKRAAVLAEESRLVQELMNLDSLDENVKEMLSVNLSTSAVSKERPIPSYRDKVEALWNYWKFLDLINFHGGPAAFSECHREVTGWKFRPEAKLRQLVLEPRGHLKSTLMCVGYTLWRIYQNPNIRIFVGTEGLKLSKAFIREVEDYLVNDFNVEHIWNNRPHFKGPLIPAMDSLGKQRRLVKDVADEFGEKMPGGSDRKKVWRAEALQVIRPRAMKEPTITAGSVGQQNTGFHFDEVIFDDVHNYENTSTEAKIDKVYSFIFDIESVLDPPYMDIEMATAFKSVLDTQFNKAARWCISGGRQTVLGTRWDEQDYYGYILENKDALGFEAWQRSLYKNGIDKEDGYLWPEKWNETLEEQTRAQLEKRHGAAGLRRYYTQYHNKIVSPEDSVFEWDKIKYLHPDSYKLCEDGWVEVYSHAHELIAEFKPSLILDPTSTGNTTSDFCAMAVGGKVQDGTIYVCDWWMKRETPRVWLDKMWELLDKWNLFVVYVEMVGGFKVLEYTITQQFLNDRSKRPISIKPWPSNTGANAIAKEQRIETTLAPLVYNEMVHLPLHCSRDQELRKQFMFFGKGTTKDDGLDVLTAMYEITIAQVRKQRHQPKSPTFRNNVVSMFGGIEYASDGTYGGVAY